HKPVENGMDEVAITFYHDRWFSFLSLLFRRDKSRPIGCVYLNVPDRWMHDVDMRQTTTMMADAPSEGWWRIDIYKLYSAAHTTELLVFFQGISVTISSPLFTLDEFSLMSYKLPLYNIPNVTQSNFETMPRSGADGTLLASLPHFNIGSYLEISAFLRTSTDDTQDTYPSIQIRPKGSGKDK
ncbi:hypothetical protein PFISCL1PPCAC_7103, partial [Pristionchus fissidentatus]